MAKIQLVQTVLTIEDIEALRMKTGEHEIKYAIAKAVAYYLECASTDSSAQSL